MAVHATHDTKVCSVVIMQAFLRVRQNGNRDKLLEMLVTVNPSQGISYVV
jgi:hypothetical protein